MDLTHNPIVKYSNIQIITDKQMDGFDGQRLLSRRSQFEQNSPVCTRLSDSCQTFANAFSQIPTNAQK